MANHKTGAQRYNDRMDKIFSDARNLEKKRLSAGEMPNPGLTSPEEGKKHGWLIKGRKVTKLPKTAMSKALNKKKETIKEYNQRHGADLSKYENN